jgi:hypothetical protein
VNFILSNKWWTILMNDMYHHTCRLKIGMFHSNSCYIGKNPEDWNSWNHWHYQHKYLNWVDIHWCLKREMWIIENKASKNYLLNWYKSKENVGECFYTNTTVAKTSRSVVVSGWTRTTKITTWSVDTFHKRITLCNPLTTLINILWTCLNISLSIHSVRKR